MPIGQKQKPAYQFDANLLMCDAVAVTSSAAMKVASAAKVLDLGSGFVEADVVLDVSAIDVSSTDEKYVICIEGSNAADFSGTPEVLSCLTLGAAASLVHGAASVVGRYVIPVRNEKVGTFYRYLRGYLTISGTTPSITATAFLAMD